MSQPQPPVAQVDSQADVALYEARRAIHPRAVRGWFAGWRVALVVLTQVVFYGGPWLTWNDRQALLFDLAQRKFYIFGLVFWPQDFILLTALLVISALSLFLFTAIAGRLWCGFACPQTVYTEIFLWIEQLIEGNHLARAKLDRQGLSIRKILIKAAKHGTWIALSVWTGYTFVGYFTPIRTLIGEAASLSFGPWETFWILFYGFATYGNAGWMREQVCKYMCPYARFQSVMFDSDTLVITYDAQRGEPRGSRGRRVVSRQAGLGDCVDCGICVQVCPTGIDIRNGLQYECIGCAACIDACNDVMEKMGYARGLIRFSTENALQGRYPERDIVRRVWRPRTLVYIGVLLVITGAAAAALALRNPLRVDIIRDRGALAREAGPTMIENVYRIQIMNTDEKPRQYRISAEGLPGLRVVGVTEPITVGAAETRLLPLRLQMPLEAEDEGGDGGNHARHEREELVSRGAHKIKITVRAIDDEEVVRHENSSFIIPR